MTRILFDTNVLLDALLAREPFVADAAFLLESVEAGEIEGFMSVTTITDVYYLVRRQTGSAETATKSVTQLLALMEICGVDRWVIEQAIALGFDDFEDAIQVTCAIALGLEAIVTHDVAGFTASPISALPSKELRNQLIEQRG